MVNNLTEFDDVSVVIITFNSGQTIKKCLNSVFDSFGHSEVIVVDNNSSDQTKRILKEYSQKINFIESNENLGFAKANNLAVSKSRKKYLLFLNPDAVVTDKKSVFLMREALINNPQFGLIGPKMIYDDGKIQLTVRNLPTIIRAFEEYLLGRTNSFEFYLPSCQTLCEVESVKGAAMFLSKEIFERVGGFDERFFLYFEDLQLCKDIRRLGLKIGYLPSVVFKHTEGVSGKGKNTKNLSLISAKTYHGPFGFYLIEVLGRIGNKTRSFLK